MREMSVFVIATSIFIASVVFGVDVFTSKASCKRIEQQPEFFEVEATAYCYGTTRCDGDPIRDGICAGKKEWYGKVIALYEQDENGQLGKFIGYYDCLDTGGDYRIKEGNCIDIYIPSYNDCIQFGRRKCLAMIIDGEG